MVNIERVFNGLRLIDHAIFCRCIERRLDERGDAAETEPAAWPTMFMTLETEPLKPPATSMEAAQDGAKLIKIKKLQRERRMTVSTGSLTEADRTITIAAPSMLAMHTARRDHFRVLVRL